MATFWLMRDRRSQDSGEQQAERVRRQIPVSQGPWPMPTKTPVLYWFQLVRANGQAKFVPRFIDDKSGVGVQLTVVDANGDGRPDILTASKLGSFLFLNTGHR